MTRHDFYQLVVPRFLDDGLPDYWAQYASGRITHFEAMRSIFSHIRCDEATLREVVHQMEPDPQLAAAVASLRAAGWQVEVVSAGCRWYIDQIMEKAGIELTVHASPGRFDPDRGLLMELPAGSPYSSPETGIDKQAVVLAARERYERVAFAGDGPPDLAPALAVDEALRFAKGWLAKELTRCGQTFARFSQWKEIADRLAP